MRLKPLTHTVGSKAFLRRKDIRTCGSCCVVYVGTVGGQFHRIFRLDSDWCGWCCCCCCKNKTQSFASPVQAITLALLLRLLCVCLCGHHARTLLMNESQQSLRKRPKRWARFEQGVGSFVCLRVPGSSGKVPLASVLVPTVLFADDRENITQWR